MMPPVAARLDDGRLHLQQGPIDLIIRIDGDLTAVTEAERAAARRFGMILEELSPQLPLLRADVRSAQQDQFQGSIARRMYDATALLAVSAGFVTPMAAVAGSVADEISMTIGATRGVRRSTVNNGGDIAVHMTPGTRVRVGLVADLLDGAPVHAIELLDSGPVRGIATSGAQGRSMSLGIADAVTVLATSCAVADAAATLIANAVDLPGHPAVIRAPARHLDPDSDLGERPVTVEVGVLSDAEVAEALEAGRRVAARLAEDHSEIHGAVLGLRGRTVIVGPDLLGLPEPSSASRTAARPGGHR
jgi:ApbE superfamily uncharacterized protein (UPF0280 family)